MRHVFFAPWWILMLASCNPPAARDGGQSDTLFNSAEHKLLGDGGYKNACSNIPLCSSELMRADGKVTFSYGELVAFAGDFYEKPSDIFDEVNNRSLRHPLSNDIEKGKSIFAEEEKIVRQQLANPKGMTPYPDNNLGFTFAFPKYLEISKNNLDHFGWHNMKTYVRFHQEAIDLALQARQQKDTDPTAAELTWRRAVFTNAFADHFLTDGFATGHIRNPRAQSLAWQKEHGHPELAVHSLAKLLHDHDHLLRDNHGPGLLVTNTRGDSWRTRCDGELYIVSHPKDRHLRLPSEAVEISMTEVLEAFDKGTSPSGVFRAAELVPFVAPGEEDLIQTFNPNVPEEQLKRWLGGLGIVSKVSFITGLDEEITRTFFGALPGIMEQFRRDVRQESTDPVLAKRLPQAYVNGYIGIR